MPPNANIIVWYIPKQFAIISSHEHTILFIVSFIYLICIEVIPSSKNHAGRFKLVLLSLYPEKKKCGTNMNLFTDKDQIHVELKLKLILLWSHAMLLLSFMSSPCELSKRQDSFLMFVSHSVSSVAQMCLTLCDPTDCSTPGLPVHHQLPELTETHVHWVGDAIQPSHPLLSPSPPIFNLSQHRGLFIWVSCSHQVAKILEFQLQNQSFQWIFRTDFH